MSEELRVDLELDLKGLLCPLPLVKLGQNITNVPVKGIIKVVTTDRGSLADIPAWARSTGNRILKQEQTGSEIVFYVERRE